MRGPSSNPTVEGSLCGEDGHDYLLDTHRHRAGAGDSPTPGARPVPNQGHTPLDVALQGSAARSHTPGGPAAPHRTVGVFAHPVTGLDGVTHKVGDADHTAAYLAGAPYLALCQATVTPAHPTVAGTPCVACLLVADRVTLADPFNLGGGRVLRWVRDALSSR
jgi:hypothetical protein